MSFDPMGQIGPILQILAFKRRQEDAEEEKGQQAFQAGMQIAQNPDMDVVRAASSLTHLDPAALPFLIETNKVAKKRQKELTATQQLQSAEANIRQLAPATAGVLQPSGEVLRNEGNDRAMAAAQAQVTPFLADLPPSLVPGAVSLAPGLRQSHETGLQQTAADRRFAQQEDQRQRAAAEATQIRGEKRAKLDQYASSIALGLAGGATKAEDARVVLMEDLKNARLVADVMTQAEVLRSGQLVMLRKTAAGVTEAQDKVDAYLTDLQERTAAMGGYIDASGKMRQPTRQDAVLKADHVLDVVDVAGKSYRVTASSAAQLGKIITYQNQYAAVDDMLDELMSIGDRIEQRVTAGEPVPGVGPAFPEFGASALRYVGQEDRDVGPYEATNLLVTMELIRLQQEGRLSDYDAKSYLAVMPSRQQIGTPEGRRRLEQVRNLMTTARKANLTPEQRKTVQRERTARRTLSPNALKATERLDAVVRRMTAEGNVEGADPQVVAAKYQEELAAAHEAWRSTGAASQWDVMPRVQNPELQPFLADPSLFPKPAQVPLAPSGSGPLR